MYDAAANIFKLVELTNFQRQKRSLGGRDH